MGTEALKLPYGPLQSGRIFFWGGGEKGGREPSLPGPACSDFTRTAIAVPPVSKAAAERETHLFQVVRHLVIRVDEEDVFGLEVRVRELVFVENWGGGKEKEKGSERRPI